MLISHEIPISMLEDSKQFNDYDYCLLHLTYEYPEYKQYYIDSAKAGRLTILDNSVFELQDALTNEQLAQGVLDIKPTQYIIPDCLDNKDVTIQRFASFVKNYSDVPGVKIGVVQGSTVEELTGCYEYMSKHADKIGISFDSKAYDELVASEDRLTRWSRGRQMFIQKLVDEGIWNNDKPHHLLGCSYAREFNYPLYRKISIESCDTSNPVVAGLFGFQYGENGLDTKPSIKLCELIGVKPTAEQLSTILYNVKQFRRICNGQI